MCPCVGVHRRMSLLSLSLLHQQCSACLECFVRWAVSDHTTAVLLGAASAICSKQHAATLWQFGRRQTGCSSLERNGQVQQFGGGQTGCGSLERDEQAAAIWRGTDWLCCDEEYCFLHIEF